MSSFKLVVGTCLALVAVAAGSLAAPQAAYAGVPRKTVTSSTYANGVVQDPRWSYLSTKRGDTSSNTVRVTATSVNPSGYLRVAAYSCANGSHTRTSNIIVLKRGTSGVLTKTQGCFRLMMQGHGGSSYYGTDFRGTVSYSVYN